MSWDNTKKKRLESLIKLRQTDRDEKRSVFASAMRRRDALTARIAEYDQSLEELRQEWKAVQLSGEAAVERLVLYPPRRDYLEKQRQALLAELELLDEEIAVKQSALEESVRQVKVLEKLKARRQEAADEEAQRRNDRLSDDQALRRENESNRQTQGE